MIISIKETFLRSKYRNYILFFLFLTVIMAIHVLADVCLLNGKSYENLYIEQFGAEKARELLEKEETNLLLSSSLVVVSYLFETLGISLVIYVGSLFFNVKIRMADAVFIVLKSYILFVAEYLVEFMYMLYKGAFIPFFTSLSAQSLAGDVPFYAVYPLHVLNLWELMFTVALIYNYKKLTQSTVKTSVRNILVPYLTVLSCWALFIVYMNLLNA